MKKYLFSLISATIGLCFAINASAITITPTGTSFGSLSDATFGGTGIPNDAVQISHIENLVLGLSATQRHANPPLTNDGAGTFQALAGGDTLDSAPNLAVWNFDYYVSGIGTGQYTRLYYDNNAAIGNDVSDYYPGGNLNYQDSENLGFGFFDGGIYDPNANGQYGFALVAYDSTGLEIGRSAILVNVGDGGSRVPDGGSTLLLLGLGFMAMGALATTEKTSRRRYGICSDWARPLA